MKKFDGKISRELFIKIVAGIFGFIDTAESLLLTERNSAGTTSDSASFISPILDSNP